MNIQAITTELFSANHNLLDFIKKEVPVLKEQQILVITSKIVALSEGRIVSITNEQEKERIIQEESDIAVHHPYGWLSIVDGLMTGSAGIDKSNVGNDMQVLLPKDSHKSAHELCTQLKETYGLKELGIIITDSRLMPLRKGTLGAAFGYAGFKGLKPYVGTPDLYGRPYERQKLNIADSLATAAVLEMGEGNESQPLAIISDVQAIEFTNQQIDKDELRIKAEDDIYKFFYHEIE